ncbi:hypothetical protein LUZ60_012019 [Juncus effusus]|nr:hypothetical protein LUZ60_012019 [Juncus effusus]
MEEVGPFRVNRDGKTHSRNKYAWNNVANILFVESPAGVGFSKSNPNQINGDTLTAIESYAFLITWLERFPEFKNRHFFIAGESYAGHYIPQLAEVILRKNKLANGTLINIIGIAIGNAYIDRLENERAKYEYFWRHGFISDEDYKPIRKNCDFANRSSICETALDKIEIGSFYLDPYNIYAPKCLTSPNDISILHTDDPEAGIDPCIDAYVEQYLNDVAAKKAFHVDVNARWLSCVDTTKKFYYPESQQPDITVPTIQKIMGKGLRVWLYSGDIDSVVGGYVEEYEGLTLATVRGSGHMVPSNQPHRALDLITNFLQGKSLPEISSIDD